ncbi:MAG: hypothetical protein MUD02_09395, partial [Bacteroidales bacterium]|nr:hypothetical protein [Bacteroidales bacterium]
VEHQLPKLRVEGSNPFSRSNKRLRKQPFVILTGRPEFTPGRYVRITKAATKWLLLFESTPRGTLSRRRSNAPGER